MTTEDGGRVADRGHLLRVLGVAFGVAVIVGGTIGQGILRSPGVVAQGGIRRSSSSACGCWAG
jgi:APA family basic amino acid/polyamine antiporter